MTKEIKLKWFLLIAVWAGCFAFCYMNINTINNILEARERKEILKKDTAFWRENTKNINIVTEKENLLTHGIESLKLGTVFLDDLFNRFGVDHNLTELKVEMDTNQSTGDRLPVRLTFKCTFKDGLAVIKILQTEYSFLFFKQVKLEQGILGKPAECEILMDYRYRIMNTQASDNTGANT
jgi:hypothetical protein